MPMRAIQASQSRLHADVHRLLSTMLLRDVADPRLAGIVITRVEASVDGHLLKVWVHAMDVDDADVCIERLNRLRPHFKHALRHALPRRRLPDLAFVWDRGMDKDDAVWRLLHGEGRA